MRSRPGPTSLIMGKFLGTMVGLVYLTKQVHAECRVSGSLPFSYAIQPSKCVQSVKPVCMAECYTHKAESGAGKGKATRTMQNVKIFLYQLSCECRECLAVLARTCRDISVILPNAYNMHNQFSGKTFPIQYAQYA